MTIDRLYRREARLLEHPNRARQILTNGALDDVREDKALGRAWCLWVYTHMLTSRNGQGHLAFYVYHYLKGMCQ
jgi:hypothetical protein